MDTSKTKVKRPLIFAIQESMMGRRRRLTEQIAINSQIQDRRFGRESTREFDSEQRPSL